MFGNPGTLVLAWRESSVGRILLRNTLFFFCVLAETHTADPVGRRGKCVPSLDPPHQHHHVKWRMSLLPLWFLFGVWLFLFFPHLFDLFLLIFLPFIASHLWMLTFCLVSWGMFFLLSLAFGTRLWLQGSLWMSWYFYPGHWPALPPRVVCPDAGPILLAVSGWTWDRYIVILFCFCPRSYFCYYLLLVAI